LDPQQWWCELGRGRVGRGIKKMYKGRERNKKRKKNVKEKNIRIL
jgi:hypothetical protein